ncbi:DUF4136 domain-containing protein [Acidobacteria bacterium ACD]|nr:MAG: DUF4136 domain-containing protein [Acidobacteriota bacterium]MCE7960186.1 DUF4136 domain-containing protein [Acidobacteria bacterium ACB2]MDL1952381.1 DUF4136 domain-containing protein [Acidobacteria bacterium ACD]
MRIPGVLAAALLVGAAACSTLELSTDYSPGTDFTRYRTFSFKGGATPRNPVAARSAEYAIGLALEGRGLTPAEAGGDLHVYMHFVLDRKLEVESYGYGTAGWYGMAWGGPVTTQVREIPVGTVVIDLVDAGSNGLVWRGVVKDEISTTAEPEEREKKAIEVARKLFAGFPPGSRE